jgi:16S rRNA (guanine527-N7)-methyltransferase
VRPEELLSEGLKALGHKPTKGRIKAFMQYLAEMKKWNRAYSLTSLKSDRDIIIKHFLDSALYLSAFDRAPGSLADVGSGAGLPGVPVKILSPRTEVFLIEPSRKKTAFLRNVARRLGLKGVTVIEKRVEDVKDLKVEAAVTRALYTAGDFIRRAGHIVSDGGVFVLSKGPKGGKELEGMDLEYVLRKASLPLTGIKRNLIIIKAGKTSGRRRNKRPERESEPVDETRARRNKKTATPQAKGICVNFECRLRKAGCFGFEGCPGYKARG